MGTDRRGQDDAVLIDENGFGSRSADVDAEKDSHGLAVYTHARSLNGGSVVGLAVTVVVMGNTLRAALVRIAPIGFAANPDFPGINGEEAFVVLFRDHAINDEEFGPFQAANAFKARTQRRSLRINYLDGGDAIGNFLRIFAAVVVGDRAVIFLAHQFA